MVRKQLARWFSVLGVAAFALCGTLALTGCDDTVDGLGQDIEAAGENISEGADNLD